MAVAVGDQRRKKEAMELLVTELSKGDDESIIHCLRTAIDRGWINSFSSILLEAKKKKDTEIDRICSRHYIDFLTSVKELLHMRGSAQELKSLVSEIHQNCHITGGELIETLNHLQKIQLERDRARSLLESCVLSKEISKMMMQVNQDIQADQHYRAMRTIELIQLEVKRVQEPSSNNAANSHVTNATLPASMLQLIEKWLPIAINKLLYSVRLESDTLLSNLRTHMHIIGQSILYRQVMIITGNLEDSKNSIMNNIINHSMIHTTTATTTSNTMTNSPLMMQQCEQFVTSFLPPKLSISLKHILSQISLFLIFPNTFPSSNVMTPTLPKFTLPISSFQNFLSYHFSINLSAQDVAMGNEILDYRMTDIAAFHKVLHLYAVLGKLSNYHQYYSNLRLDVLHQIWKQLEVNINSFGLLKACYQFFESLIGFFTIESMLSKMIEIPHHTFSSLSLQQLWRESMSYFQEQVNNIAITLTSENDLIQLKEECMLLLHIISDEMYKLDIDVVVEVMKTFWDIFDALQMSSLSAFIQDTLAKIAYQPFHVSNNDDLLYKIRIYSLDTLDIDQAGVIASSPSALSQSNSMNHKGMMDSKLLDRHLDALEEEITTSFSNPSNGQHMNPGQHNGSNASNGTVGRGNSLKPADNTPFVSQTFAFSEFVSLFLKEIHGRMIKLFIFSIIKLPNQGGTAAKHDPKHPFASTAAMLAGNHSSNQKVSAKEYECQKEGYEAWYGMICHSVMHMYETMSRILLQELKRDGNETALSKVCQIFIDTSMLALTVEMFMQMLEHALIHFASYDFYMYPSSTSSSSALHMNHSQSSKNANNSNAASQQQLILEKIHSQVNKAQQEILQHIQSVSSTAQDLIFELLAHKIQDLSESLVFINFAPDTAPSPNINLNTINIQNPNPAFIHESIESIIEFLSITFMWLTHLPLFLREAIYFTSCTHLANGILQHLLSSQVQSINIFGLLSLDADCKRLFQFADSCGVDSLRQCFIELQELVQCMLSNDLPNYIDHPNARRRVFPHVDSNKLASLLDKVLPSPLIAQSGNLPRFDKVMTKQLVKKLRMQSNQY